jgi:putative ABC transport system permease protein
VTDTYLVLKNLTRNKLRLVLNCFAILIAFLLFGALGSLQHAFTAGIELSADNRLIVVNKINFTQPLPIAYVNKVRAIDGISKVTHANWFGAYYQDARRPMVGLAVDGDSYLDIYDNILLSDGGREAWLKERQGVIVGERMAHMHGWKVGDRIPISSNIFSQADGSTVWDMVISDIFRDKEPSADTNFLLFHYKYFIETQTFGKDWVGWMILTTEDSSLNERVAKAIDTYFANSSTETDTSTEKAFNRSFLEQVGSIGLIITSVIFAAFFTILLIVGNSMALSIRERTREIAVLKTIGFAAPRIFGMVLAESISLALIGGLLGLGVAVMLINGASSNPQLQSMLPNLIVPPSILIQALGYMLALGLITGIFPALRAMRLNTIDALNRG